MLGYIIGGLVILLLSLILNLSYHLEVTHEGFADLNN